MLRLPRVDDRRTPESAAPVPLLVFDGVNQDSDDSPEDDFSAEEPFAAKENSLDACGEPDCRLPEVRLDGDGTVVEGRDCFADDRFADAFSMTFALEAVSAVFAGGALDWQAAVEGPCDGQPEQSLWTSAP